MTRKKTTTKKATAPATTGVAAEGVSEFHRFMALSAAEKSAEAAEFDRRDFTSLAESSPLTPAQRRAWEKTQAELKAGHAEGELRPERAPGRRPVVGKGTKSVSVSVDRGLLAEADAFAKRHKLKRTALFAAGLRMVLSGEPG